MGNSFQIHIGSQIKREAFIAWIAELKRCGRALPMSNAEVDGRKIPAAVVDLAILEVPPTSYFRQEISDPSNGLHITRILRPADQHNYHAVMAIAYRLWVSARRRVGGISAIG
jgi:hypothetical protein